MKKLASLLLILLYFTFSAGATIRLHYCMGEYANFFIINTANEKSCSQCGMNKHQQEKNCCNDIVVTAKISDPHGNSQIIHVLKIPAFDINSNFPETNIAKVIPAWMSPAIQKQPPGDKLYSLYLYYRNIRI